MTGSDLLRLLDRATAYPSWMAFASFVVVAAVKAATASPPPPLPAPSQAVRQQVFSAMAGQEGTFRTKAARNFPGDAWSQDDDFHAMEMQAATRQAALRGISLGEVLRAWDDGLREHWAPADATFKNSVPPCRPRPVY